LLDNPPLIHRYQLLAQKPDVFAGGTMRKVSGWNSRSRPP
jgi:hypothetical protein